MMTALGEGRGVEQKAKQGQGTTHSRLGEASSEGKIKGSVQGTKSGGGRINWFAEWVLKARTIL